MACRTMPCRSAPPNQRSSRPTGYDLPALPSDLENMDQEMFTLEDLEEPDRCGALPVSMRGINEAAGRLQGGGDWGARRELVGAWLAACLCRGVRGLHVHVT